MIDWVRTHPLSIDHFQVFGERRSGTNFLNRLVADNFDLTPTTKYGWKHGLPTMPVIARTGLILVVMREPLGWLSSLHNRPFARSHMGLSFSEFLRTEWYDEYKPKDFGQARWGYGGMIRDEKTANQIDRHPITGRRFRNPLEMRGVKQAGFLGFLNRECNAAIVDYDQTRQDPGKVLSAIADSFGLVRAADLSVPGHVGARGTAQARVAADDIAREDLEFIRAELDAEQEARLGYAHALS